MTPGKTYQYLKIIFHVIQILAVTIVILIKLVMIASYLKLKLSFKVWRYKRNFRIILNSKNLPKPLIDELYEKYADVIKSQTDYLKIRNLLNSLREISKF